MLNIDWTTEEPASAAGQLLVVPLREGHDPEVIAQRFGAAIRDAVGQSTFVAKPGESYTLTRLVDAVAQHVMLIGTGDLTEPAALRQLAHDAAREAQRVGASHLVLDLHGADGLPAEGDDALVVGSLVAQGLELGTYAYDRFLSESNRRPVSLTQVSAWGRSAAPADGSTHGQVVAASVARARDLGNGPPGLVTPSLLAQTAADIVEALSAEGHDVELTVLEREQCEARGMGCYLGVAQGSDEPPKFIHLAYRPNRGEGSNAPRVCLIGKGVTFDSGGYSLKPTDGMLDMKLDMCGSAAVIAAFEGAVKLEVPYEVHAIVAAAENLVSGKAYKLGDVLTASNGKTVEINNTDAEGRLLLGDGVSWAARELKATDVINAATLTGAQLISTGTVHAAVITNDEALEQTAVSVGRQCGDLCHPLPFAPELYRPEFNSPIADLRNSVANRMNAQTSCAAQFVYEHIASAPKANKRRWCHIDLAGPAFPKDRGTGYGVALISELVRAL